MIYSLSGICAVSHFIFLCQEKTAEKKAQKSVITLFNLIGDDPLPGDYPFLSDPINQPNLMPRIILRFAKFRRKLTRIGHKPVKTSRNKDRLELDKYFMFEFIFEISFSFLSAEKKSEASRTKRG